MAMVGMRILKNGEVGRHHSFHPSIQGCHLVEKDEWFAWLKHDDQQGISKYSQSRSFHLRNCERLFCLHKHGLQRNIMGTFFGGGGCRLKMPLKYETYWSNTGCFFIGDSVGMPTFIDQHCHGTNLSP